MKTKNISLFLFIASMLIFGTVGMVRRMIPLSSPFIALTRGILGTLFISAVYAIKREKPDIAAIKRNFTALIVSGGFVGINWILLFEAYLKTSVPTATLCYYMAPVIVVLLSPIFASERLTLKKLICVFAAVVGMLLSSGIIGDDGEIGIVGIILALTAAFLYSAIILLNKKLRDIKPFDRTAVQLASASVVMFPYVLATEDFSAVQPGGKTLILLAVMGIVHTGVAYTLYFGSMGGLSAQSAAILAYIDPATTLILTPVIYPAEKLSFSAAVGAALIIISAIVCELPEKRRFSAS